MAEEPEEAGPKIILEHFGRSILGEKGKIAAKIKLDLYSQTGKSFFNAILAAVEVS